MRNLTEVGTAGFLRAVATDPEGIPSGRGTVDYRPDGQLVFVPELESRHDSLQVALEREWRVQIVRAAMCAALVELAAQYPNFERAMRPPSLRGARAITGGVSW